MANGLLSKGTELYNFINQPIESIARQLGPGMKTVMNTVTDAGAWVSKLFGRGLSPEEEEEVVEYYGGKRGRGKAKFKAFFRDFKDGFKYATKKYSLPILKM